MTGNDSRAGIMDISEIKNKAVLFAETLKKEKARVAPPDLWYPYGTIDNLVQLESILTGANRSIIGHLSGKQIADIGGADGDLAFFMESLGARVDFIDYAPTNFNGLKGVKTLKASLNSSVEIHELNLDARFELPRKDYDAIFFLGILYHLKNPYYVLETLAKATSFCFISTRIARMTTDRKVNFSGMPVAYLLNPLECNNDSSNYWIFSDAGLRRLLFRAGWDILDYATVGNITDSDPSSPGRDERAVCLVRSRVHNAGKAPEIPFSAGNQSPSLSPSATAPEEVPGELAGEVGRLRLELESVYNSKSWRLTYPLRWVSGMLKGVKAR